jgi:hypothetical protein
MYVSLKYVLVPTWADPTVQLRLRRARGDFLFLPKEGNSPEVESLDKT